MPPNFADLFGRKLLGKLFEGEPVGRALFEVRREFLDKCNLLGFAYTYYGNAYHRLVEQGKGNDETIR